MVNVSCFHLNQTGSTLIQGSEQRAQALKEAGRPWGGSNWTLWQKNKLQIPVHSAATIFFLKQTQKEPGSETQNSSFWNSDLNICKQWTSNKNKLILTRLHVPQKIQCERLKAAERAKADLKPTKNWKMERWAEKSTKKQQKKHNKAGLKYNKVVNKYRCNTVTQ